MLPLVYINLNLDKNFSCNNTLSCHMNFVMPKARDLLLWTFITKPSRKHKQEHCARHHDNVQKETSPAQRVWKKGSGITFPSQDKQSVCWGLERLSPFSWNFRLSMAAIMELFYACQGSPAAGLKHKGMSVSSNLAWNRHRSRMHISPMSCPRF